MASLILCLHILLLALGVSSNPLPQPVAPKPCTTYLTKIIPGIYIPETVYTVYTTTETVYSLVPCKGCVLATTTLYAPGAGGGIGGPYGRSTTITASVPYNVTSAVCAPTFSPHHISARQVLERDTIHSVQEEHEGEDDSNLDPDLKISAKPPPTARKTKTKCQLEANTIIATGTLSEITLPGGGRTRPIEPTSLAVFRRQDGTQETLPVIVNVITTTLTVTSRSWSSTTTTTKYTTCYLGPLQDPNPGAIPRRAVDAEGDGCVGSAASASATPPPSPASHRPTSTKTQRTTIYKTIIIPETGVLTRTTVKCTKTALTRRPRPTFTLDAGSD